MYKIERKYLHDMPTINGSEFDINALEGLTEITASRFGELISRTTGGNGGSPFAYTKELSWYKTSADTIKVLPDSSKFHWQYHGTAFIWNDGVVLFALTSYVGGEPKFLTGKVCDHTYAETSIGRCVTQFTCTKCNHSFTNDSAD